MYCSRQSANLSADRQQNGGSISPHHHHQVYRSMDSTTVDTTDLLTPWPQGAERAHLARWCGCRRSNWRLLFLVVAYVLFLVAGACIFIVLEMPLENELRHEVMVLKQKVLRDGRCFDAEAPDELDYFVEEVIMAYKRGVIAIGNTTMEPNWSFGQSLFFAATVVTTIGYGHVTPLSEGGKLFCMVFALLGIPLTLTLLTAMVERLMVPATVALHFLNSRLGHLYQPFHIRVFHLSLVVGLVASLFFLLPAAVFASLEPDWDFLDALYYCIISLTTIGLGDYVPGDSAGQPYRLLYKIGTTIYLLIGLTFMMLMLTVFYDIPQLNFGLFFLLRSDEHTGDPEKMCLHGGGGGGKSRGGPKYTAHVDEPIRENIRIKPRPGDDLSSPEDGRP